MCLLASSVCKSLQCLISTLTQGGEDGHLFRLPCSVVLWGGKNTANKCHWCAWRVLAVYGPHWVCPSSWHKSFPGLHCSGSRLLCRGSLQREGPGFRELPRPKLLRFRFLGILQRHSLSWTCVLCHSQVRAAQATRCFVSTVPGDLYVLISSLVSATQFPG